MTKSEKSGASTLNEKLIDSATVVPSVERSKEPVKTLELMDYLNKYIIYLTYPALLKINPFLLFVPQLELILNSYSLVFTNVVSLILIVKELLAIPLTTLQY